MKGGAFAGNVYELFANARFARETALAEEYHGPVAVRFDGARVVGA